MTENEAIEELKYDCNELGKAIPCDTSWGKSFENAYAMAINALEEVQKYRKIEKDLKERYHANVDIPLLMHHFIETVFEGEKHEGFCLLTNEDAKVWEEYKAIGTPEECRTAMEKQIVEKELESHDEKYILKYCISLMQELVGKFEEWYEYVHGEDAIRELDEEERFYYRMSYFSIVQELFLFRTSHSGGTSTRAKCKQLGVDWSDGIEFSFGGDEE
jgi:hypothetical protein